MSNNHIKTLSIYVLIIISYAIVFCENSFVENIGREDGPIENIGAIFFLIASFIFFIAM